jgi:FkbM family methyltransferase
MNSTLKRTVRSLFPQKVWEALIGLRWKFIGDASTLGRQAAFTLATAGFIKAPSRGRTMRGALWRIQPKGFQYPVYLRAGGSDRLALRQVLVSAEYGCVGSETDVSYIMDCGANVGYTSFFLLHRYPSARAIVVEPDPDNMRVCRRNLAPFADRVLFVQAGVWSASAPMVLQRGCYRDGAEWSTQVRVAATGERPDFNAYTIPDLMAAGSFPRIDLLKVDIESSEIEVFDESSQRWVPRIKTLVIELHGRDCEAAVSRAVAPFAPSIEKSGELTVFRFS